MIKSSIFFAKNQCGYEIGNGGNDAPDAENPENERSIEDKILVLKVPYAVGWFKMSLFSH